MGIQAAKCEAAIVDDIEAAISFIDYSRWTHEPMVSEEYEKWTERQREAWHLAELSIDGDCHRQAILEYDHVLAVLADLPAALEALEEAQGKIRAEIKVTVAASKGAANDQYYRGRLDGLLYVLDRILRSKEGNNG